MLNVRSCRMLALLVMAITILFAGCGGGAKDEARKLSKRSVIAKAPPLSKLLISDEEIRRASKATPEQAFLIYWASLQFQAWDNAAAYYSDDLREFLGDDRLQYALANQTAYFRSNRPRNIKIQRSNGRSIARFIVEDFKGTETPESTSWERRNGVWKIVHDPFLDSALAQARQLDIQTAIDPTSQKPSKEAIRAAYAARKLQASYSASKQDASKRSGTPPAR